MKTRFISLFLPAWLGCGGVVDLGPVEGAGMDTVTGTEFEPALIELAPWHRGMCGLFSDELVRCWNYEEKTAWVVPGLTGIALGGTDGSNYAEDPPRVCAVQRSGTVTCVDSTCYHDDEDFPDCRLDGTPYVVYGLDDSVGISVDERDVTALRSDGTLAIVRDCADLYPYSQTIPNCGEQAEFELEEPIVAFHSFGNFVTVGGIAYATTIEYESAVIEQYRIVPRDDYNTTFPPLPVPGVEDAVAIEATNGGVNYILRRSGTITGWGPLYMLGMGSTQPIMGSGDVADIDDAVAMDANSTGACAIRSDRTLWCWGISNSSNLGFPDAFIDEDGRTEYSDILFAPRRVPDLDDVRKLTMSGGFTCVGRGTNEVWCWGWQGWHGTRRTPTHTPYRVTMH